MKLIVTWLAAVTFFNFYWSIVDFYWSIVNTIVLVSALQQNELVIYIYIFVCMYIYIHSFRFFSHIGHYRVLSSRLLQITYFIYSSVYMSIPISQFIPHLQLFLKHSS